MKKIIFFIFALFFLSQIALAYHGTSGNYEWRFFNDGFGANASAGNYEIRANAGGYPADTFSSGGYSGQFQDYDLNVSSSPTPSQTTRGGGGGGGGGVRLVPRGSYSIRTGELVAGKSAKIHIDPAGQGQLFVSFNKNGKWFFEGVYDVVNGITTFMPTLPGRYKFDFKRNNVIVSSTEAVARVKIANRGFQEILESPKKESPVKESPAKVDKAVFKKVEEQVPVIEGKKEVEVSPLLVFLAFPAGLILLLALFVLLRPSKKQKIAEVTKLKRVVANEKPAPISQKKKLNKKDIPAKSDYFESIESDLKRVDKELAELKRKYKF
ncbi:hypothetical protein DRJ25_00380 [Candidatus Woesearchaeota archaeon]|nr:MAG: hypothetical protein DRJ25_00380 [Candidatus Woesearchaeota archaeon]